MTDSTTTIALPARPPAELGADAPSSLEALAAKLERLQSYSSRYGITCTPAALLAEILADVRNIQAVCEAEWISAAQAAQISSYSTERLRQLAATGRLTRNGSRYLRGEIQRLKHRLHPVPPTLVKPVESPPAAVPDADGDERTVASADTAPAPTPRSQRAPQNSAEEGIRNPITGRVLGIHANRLRQ